MTECFVNHPFFVIASHTQLSGLRCRIKTMSSKHIIIYTINRRDTKSKGLTFYSYSHQWRIQTTLLTYTTCVLCVSEDPTTIVSHNRYSHQGYGLESLRILWDTLSESFKYISRIPLCRLSSFHQEYVEKTIKSLSLCPSSSQFFWSVSGLDT